MRKIYLTRALTRAWAIDMPVGDPHGGTAYGERNDPASAIFAIGQIVTGMAATDAVVSGLMIAGGALSLIGNVTGSEDLMKIGAVAGLAGGVYGFVNDSFSAASTIEGAKDGAAAGVIQGAQTVESAGMVAAIPTDGIALTNEMMGASDMAGTTARLSGSLPDVPGASAFGPDATMGGYGASTTQALADMAGWGDLNKVSNFVANSGDLTMSSLWDKVKTGATDIGTFMKAYPEATMLVSGALGQIFPSEANQSLTNERNATANFINTRNGILQQQQRNANNITGLRIGMAPNPNAQPFNVTPVNATNRFGGILSRSK